MVQNRVASLRQTLRTVFVLALTLASLGVLSLYSFAASEIETIALYSGETFELKSYLLSQNQLLGNAPVWKTSNKEVAAVSTNGLVTGAAPGEAMITATATTGLGIREAKVRVVVSSAVSSVTISETSKTLVMGETFSLTAKVSPVLNAAKVFNEKIKWTSSDTRYVTVDEQGKVTAVKTGKATVTATSVDGNKTATCEVTVINVVTSIRLSESDGSINIGEKRQLIATLEPANAPVQKVIFKSSQPKLITVSETGLMEGVSEGEAMITATTVDGAMVARVFLRSTSMVSGIKLSQSELTLSAGAPTATLEAWLLPKNPNQLPLQNEIKWTSSDSATVSVSSKGEVKALKSGTATITATSTDGGYSARCLVKSTLGESSNTRVDVTMIQFVEPPTTVYTGQLVNVLYKTFPEHATQTSGQVTVSPSAIDTKAANGQLSFTPMQVGKHLVTLKIGNVTNGFYVNVKPSVLKVELTAPGLEESTNGKVMYLGQTAKLQLNLQLEGITKEQLNPNAIKWVNNANDVTFTRDAKDPYVVQVKLNNPNSTMLYATVMEGMGNGTLRISYEPMAQEMKLAAQALVKVGTDFSPEIELVPKPNLKYGFTEVIEKGFTVVIKEKYLDSRFLKNEIDYETKLIPTLLEEAAKYPEGSKKTELIAQWTKHIQRKKNLELLMTDYGAAYQKMAANAVIKDREDRTVNFFSLNGTTLKTDVNGKALVVITSKDGRFSKEMWVVADTQEEELVLLDASGNRILSASDKAREALKQQVDKEQATKLAALAAKLKQTSPKDRPSNAYLESVVKAIEKGLVTEAQFMGKYGQPLTKLELVKLLNKAYVIETGKVLKPVSTRYFSDVNDPDAEIAYQLGLVSGNKTRTFGGNALVDSKIMVDMMQRWVKATKHQADNMVIKELAGSAKQYSHEEAIRLIILLIEVVK